MTTSIDRAFADYAYAKGEFDYWAGGCDDSTGALGKRPTDRHKLRVHREWRQQAAIACDRLRQAFALAEPERQAQP
jgi:hypothetical protein